MSLTTGCRKVPQPEVVAIPMTYTHVQMECRDNSNPLQPAYLIPLIMIPPRRYKSLSTTSILDVILYGQSSLALALTKHDYAFAYSIKYPGTSKLHSSSPSFPPPIPVV